MMGAMENGVVLDHITAGRGMEIYRALHLDELECTVAMICNARSVKMGRKDIIKIGAEMELDWQVLGFLDPGITVNIIRGGEVVRREHLTLPERIVDVLRCRNPRCITSVEQGIHHEFRLSDRKKRTYRCIYCENEA